MKHNNTVTDYTSIQLKLPVDLERIIKINDPVYTFNEVVSHIDRNQYFARKERKTGRPEDNRETLFKLVLFAFIELGYCSVRQILKLYKTDICFLWLLDERKVSGVMIIQNFIHNNLMQSLDDIFTEINACIFEKEHVATSHIYIDGTKRKANAGNYTWVWKKSCIKQEQDLFSMYN